MEPLLFVLLPGALGGLLMALVLGFRPRRPPSTVVVRRLEPASPALINMAHIRVEGLGGLGLFAAVILVAIVDPRIRLAIIAAAVLGAGVAIVLIAIRRRTGALPSGGNGPDDRSVLHLDLGSPTASTREISGKEIPTGPPARVTILTA